VDVLRRDVLDLHEAIARVHELEGRIQTNVLQDTRLVSESMKSDILRDVGQHMVRFDQALVELAQESASLRTRVMASELEAPTITYQRATSTLGGKQSVVSVANQQPLFTVNSNAGSVSSPVDIALTQQRQPSGAGFRIPSASQQASVMAAAPSNPSSGRGTPVSSTAQMVAMSSYYAKDASQSQQRPQTSVVGQGGGGSWSNVYDGLVSATPRQVSASFGTRTNDGHANISTSRVIESPDRSSTNFPLNRGGTIFGRESREDPLQGVFSDVQASP
jgi:hypothetical protein